MLIAQSRLGDADAAKYAYGDEWYSFDQDVLLAKPSSELIELEKVMDFTIGELLVGLGRRSTEAMRAALWIARKLVHADIEKFKDFDPVVWQAMTRVVDESGTVLFDVEGSPVEGEATEGDADPLEGGSPDGSQSTTTS